MKAIIFSVAGEPRAKQSFRVSGRGHGFTPPQVKAWQSEIAWYANQAIKNMRPAGLSPAMRASRSACNSAFVHVRRVISYSPPLFWFSIFYHSLLICTFQPPPIHPSTISLRPCAAVCRLYLSGYLHNCPVVEIIDNRIFHARPLAHMQRIGDNHTHHWVASGVSGVSGGNNIAGCGHARWLAGRQHDRQNDATNQSPSHFDTSRPSTSHSSSYTSITWFGMRSATNKNPLKTRAPLTGNADACPCINASRATNSLKSFPLKPARLTNIRRRPPGTSYPKSLKIVATVLVECRPAPSRCNMSIISRSDNTTAGRVSRSTIALMCCFKFI
jgi:hypothetical protein